MDKNTEIDWQVFAKTLEHEFANDLFNCNDSYERLYIKKLLKKELPELSENRIEYIMDQCCTMLQPPCTIKDLTEYLKKIVS